MSGGYVLDASVAVKTVLPEDSSEQAKQLFFNLLAEPPVSLHVPGSFYAECANILWQRVRFRGYAVADAKADLMDLLSLPFTRTATAELALRALELAVEFGVSPYDATYAALAEQLGVPLVTADESLVRHLAGSGVEARWLGEL